MVSSIPVTDLRARLLRELAGETGPVEPSDVEFSHWVDVATTDRVLPLLYSVARAGPSALSLANIDWANSVELDAMAAAVRIEHGLIEVAKLLRSEQHISTTQNHRYVSSPISTFWSIQRTLTVREWCSGEAGVGGVPTYYRGTMNTSFMR